MEALIEDLLEYSKVDSRANPFEAVDLNQVFDEAVELLKEPIAEAAASVRRPGDLPTVTGDRIQLLQVLQNLIGNAIKYRRENLPPEVTLEAEPGEDGWVVAVADNGIGIEPKFREQVFAMFRRLHDRKRYPGTGIGLAICSRVVARHGGRIWTEPSAAGGSRFCFTLPRTPPPSGAAAATPPRGPGAPISELAPGPH